MQVFNRIVIHNLGQSYQHLRKVLNINKLVSYINNKNICASSFLDSGRITGVYDPFI
jgi:hypothetical protein